MSRILLSSFVLFISCCFNTSFAQLKIAPVPLSVGFSTGLHKIDREKMNSARAAGIDYVEISFGEFIDQDRNFKVSEEEIFKTLKRTRKAAEDAGIKIWSVHMPFGKQIDLSLANEAERQKVVALQKKVLEFCRILQPEVILFHPSYYLGLNEREIRKSQMIKSACELNETVKDMEAIMVIENMLGYELQLNDGERERPLCRTVEEMVEIMSRLPDDIYAAVDMNHIKEPEKLIRAMGMRLKSVHIADGSGKKEDHFFPCSGQGENNWTEILAALYEVQYTGPFMFECAYQDVRDLKECYDSIYNNFVAEKNLKP